MRVPSLIVLILLVTIFWSYSRWLHPPREESPAVLRSAPGRVTVALAIGEERGVYQFYDADGRQSVIGLTGWKLSPQVTRLLAALTPLTDGELIALRPETGVVVRGWMPATHRMLLAIPLHPDRMTASDWESLPGIGPKLAAAIEFDRQKNGDFVSLAALDRVKGIGPKKLEGWKVYFEAERAQREK